MPMKSSHRRCDWLWKEHFRDPSHRWDDRNSNNKVKEESLWLDPCVSEELSRRRRIRRLEVSSQALVCTPGRALVPNKECSRFVALLRSCAKSKDLDKGISIHDDIVNRGFLEECSDALITMYAKCGALAKAKELLDLRKSRNVVPWTALIVGYVQQGQAEKALNCYKRMRNEGVLPDPVTFSSILKACGSTRALDKGVKIHEEISKQGLLVGNVILGTALVDMYVKCGNITRARKVLEDLPSRDAISWSALIAGYAEQGQGEQALACFEQMQSEGLVPDSVTLAAVFKACGSIRATRKGEQIHDEIARQGWLVDNIKLGTALVDMYAKCGALMKAQQVLEELPSRDVVSWNALIAGYVQQGQGEQALTLYEQMRREGIPPDMVTFVCVLKACGNIEAADKGEQIYDEISRQGLLGKNLLLGTAVVDMCVKCGDLVKAQQVLEQLPVRDVVSWNALIAGYAQKGEGEEALTCLERMRNEGLVPDMGTFTCMLKACGGIGAIDKGEEIHEEVARQDLLKDNVVLRTALVDMYAKCGALEKARRLLEELSSQDVTTWNALMAGHVQRGQGEEALMCFSEMQHDSVSPDATTFSCVLSACSHLSLVDGAQMCFLNMAKRHGRKPDLEHCVCMLDLFWRAGHLDKAAGLIEKMQCADYLEVWSALLGACRKWGGVNIGRWAFDQALQLNKSDAAAFILMSNVYGQLA